MKNSKVTSLGKSEVQGFIVLTSKLKSITQKKSMYFNNFYRKTILLGSNGRQRHMPDITELEF